MPPPLPNSASPQKRRVGSPGNGNHVPHIPRETTIPDPNLKCDGHHNSVACTKPTKETSQELGLLSLPCELLEMVASHLRQGQHILRFALINKRIHGIVQEILARDLVLSGRYAKRFLELLATRPELINKVNSVDLGNYGCTHHEKCLCLGKPNFEPDILKFLGTAIASNTQHTVRWSQIRKAKLIRGPVWRESQAFFLDILVALCPNINSVTIELPEARDFGSNNPSRFANPAPHPLPALNPELTPVAPFQGAALQVLQQQLESLTIVEDSRWKGPAATEVLERQDIFWRNMGKFTITLPGFVRLRRLDVPMEVFGHPQNMIFLGPNHATTHIDNSFDETQAPRNIRSRFLPPTLKYLHLRSCSQLTFALLQRLNKIPIEKLQLELIEVFFRPRSQAFIVKCNAADDGQLNYLRLLSDLRQKGVKISFYTGPQEDLVDMREELSALSALSDFEVYSFSISQSPCSSLDMRASKTRRSHISGIRLFVRHASPHLQLFNRPTFDARVWSQSAFFHGIKNTKWDPNISDPKAEVRTIDRSHWPDRPNGKREGRYRLPKLLNLDSFNFAFRVEQNMSPSPKHASFFAINVDIPEDIPGKSTANASNNEKQVSMPEKENMTLSDEGRCIDRQEEKKIRKKSLEHTEAEMQLDSHSGTTADEVPYTKDSKFDSSAWVKIKWIFSVDQGAMDTSLRTSRASSKHRSRTC